MVFVSDTLDTRMYEGIMDEWEMENQQPSQPIERLSDKKRISAYAKVNTARFLFKMCIDDIEEAMCEIQDTPQCDKLASIYDQLSDLMPELKNVEGEIWRCKNDD